MEAISSVIRRSKDGQALPRLRLLNRAGLWVNVLELRETPIVTQRGAQGEKLFSQLSVYTEKPPLQPICKHRQWDLMLLFE